MSKEIAFHSEKPVAVTGAGGSMARHYVERLAGQGVQVRGIARRQEDLDWLSQIPNVTAYKGDVTQPETLKRPFDGAGTVIHTAVKDSFTDWQGAMEVNVGGTENVVREAEAAGVEKFHHLSTVAVYGEQEDSRNITEDAALNGEGPYPKTKAMQEEIVFDGGNRFNATAIRPANVIGQDVDMWTHAILNGLDGLNREVDGYGSEQIAAIASKLSKQWMRRLTTLTPIILNETVFATIEIENAVDLSIRAMQNPNAAGHAFNAVDDNISTARLFDEYLTKVLGRPSITAPRALTAPITFALDNILKGINIVKPNGGIEIVRKLAFHGSSYSTEKADKMLGHDHRISFDESVARTAEYVRRNGLLESRKLYK